MLGTRDSAVGGTEQALPSWVAPHLPLKTLPQPQGRQQEGLPAPWLKTMNTHVCALGRCMGCSIEARPRESRSRPAPGPPLVPDGELLGPQGLGCLAALYSQRSAGPCLVGKWLLSMSHALGIV